MKSIKIKDHSVSKEVFTLEYLSDLHIYKTNPVPSNLGEYYESEDYISHTDSKKTFIDKLYQSVKTITLWQKTKLLFKLSNKKRISVLDFGCGTGDFVKYLQDQKWNAVGVEPNLNALNLALAKGINVFSDVSQINNQKFDIITLWHVLEHVPNYNETIKQLSTLLNENGKIVIALPNFESFDANYYGNFWAAWDVPRHIWHFSEKGIKSIMKKLDYSFVKEKAMIFDAFYVSLLSEKYKSKKSNFFTAFKIGLISNLKALKNAHFSSKIYIFSKKSI